MKIVGIVAVILVGFLLYEWLANRAAKKKNMLDRDEGKRY